MKRCWECKEAFPYSAFNKDRARHDGLQGACRACQKKRAVARQIAIPEYAAYTAAKCRCNNPTNPGYPHYGGRGIAFRFATFEEFRAEVGPRPSPEYSLDRINNNGHYERGNVRWATAKMQTANRRTKRIEHFTTEELLNELERRTPGALAARDRTDGLQQAA